MEIISCDPSIYEMDHPDFNTQMFISYYIGLQRV